MQSNTKLDEGNAWGRNRWPVAAFAALVALTAYLATLAPTVNGGDSGELISAAYSMGVPHPPGYPLWCILAKVWMTAIPAGEIAWRVNLLSAVLGAGAVFMLVLLAYETGLPSAGALAAGLAFGLSKTFWSQSIIAKFYPLSALLAITCIYFAMRHENAPRDRYLYASAFFFGLGIVAHQLTMTLLPAIALLLITRRPRQVLRPAKVATAAVLASIPLLLYIYTLLCSRANPPINWGHPSDLASLWRHFTRHQYPNEFTKNPRSLALFIRQFGRVIDDGLHEYTPVICALAPAGGLAMMRGLSLRKCVFWLAVLLIATLGFILQLSPPLERENLETIKVFFINGWMALSICLGASVAFVAAIPAISARPRLKACAPYFLCAVVAAILVAVNFPKVNMRGNYLAYDYAANTLRTIAPNAVIFPGGDHNTFPLLYCTIVEGKRPDVTIADKYGYIERSVYKDIAAKYPELPTQEQRMEIMAWILKHEKRPIYCSDPPSLPDIRMRQEGITMRIVSAMEPAGSFRDFWREYKWHNITGDDIISPTEDYSSQMILADYCTMRARYFLTAGNRERGKEMLARAAGHGYAVKEFLNNLGSLAAENHLTDLAESFFRQAIDVDPSYQTPYRNLDTMHAQNAGRKPQPGMPEGLSDMMHPLDPMSFLPPDLRPPAQQGVPGGPQEGDTVGR